MKDLRDAVFDEIYNLARDDKDVVFLSADADAWSLKKFKNDFPDRYINVGVAEQNMVTVAAGLALSGKKVFICGLIPFVTLRCMEQIKVNVCSMNLSVIIVGLGAGFSFGYDGPTHHAVCDISAMSILPEMSIYNPCTPDKCIKSVKEAYDSNSPSYIRVDKGEYDDVVSIAEYEGFSEIIKGHKQCIVSTGIITHTVIDVVNKLFDKSIGVIDIHKIKSFNKTELSSVLQKYDDVVVIEENVSHGGLGSTVSEITPVHRLCLPDEQCMKYGDREWLLSQYGMDKDGIFKKMKNICNDF